MNDSESLQRATAAALRFLSYRPRSEAEVRGRLRRRFPSHVVQQVVADLAEQSLLDDAKFARLWRDNRDSFRPRSAAAIERELIAKGVARDTAQAAVSDMDDHDAAHRAGLKLTRRLDRDDFATFRRRLWGYLQRRGFSGSVTRHAIDRLWDDLSRPDEAEDPAGTRREL